MMSNKHLQLSPLDTEVMPNNNSSSSSCDEVVGREITYDIILEYLTKKKNSFITNKHNCNNNFNNKFSSILTSEYYRYGINIYDSASKKNNISFWSSLLILLKEDYLINIDDFSLITEYKNNLIENYNKKISSFLKKYEKNDFREYLKLNPDIIIIQYVVDILNINIIIFDFNENSEDKIYTVYKTDIMNPELDTILLANCETFWEPIMNKDKKKFNYDDDIIKNILNQKVEYYSSENINKKFLLSLNNEKCKQNDTNNNSRSKFERKKKVDLIKILENNNISFPKKNTNKQLIDIIIENNLTD